MTNYEIDKLISGIGNSTAESWKELQAKYRGGTITTPMDDEVSRRKEYQTALITIFFGE